MIEKRNNIIALIAAGLFITLGFCASAAADEPTAPGSSDMDFATLHDAETQNFTRHLGAALDYRLARIISLDRFAEMKTEENTVILDTRSASAFTAGHIYGAVNLPLSDMTLLNLADTVPDRTSRILIYSHQNVANAPVRADYNVRVLPLNLLTYISLYRYGYLEVYELGERAAPSDDQLAWVNGGYLLAAAETAADN